MVAAERDHCNKTVDIYEDVSSPAVTSKTWGKPLTCWYRFRAFRGTPRDWILRVRFKKFKVGVLEDAATCSGGYLQVSSSPIYTEKNCRLKFNRLFEESWTESKIEESLVRFQ